MKRFGHKNCQRFEQTPVQTWVENHLPGILYIITSAKEFGDVYDADKDVSRQTETPQKRKEVMKQGFYYSLISFENWVGHAMGNDTRVLDL